MASGKLDQSLDEILSGQRKANRGRATRRTSAGNRPTTTAPAGGIQKNKPGRNAAKPTPAKGSSGVVGESKIFVSYWVCDYCRAVDITFTILI